MVVVWALSVLWCVLFACVRYLCIWRVVGPVGRVLGPGGAYVLIWLFAGCATLFVSVVGVSASEVVLPVVRALCGRLSRRAGLLGRV